MSKLLYTAGVSVFNFLFHLAALFNPKAKKIIKGRRETWALLEQFKTKSNLRYWFHCASLGEFEQARPVMEAIKNENTAAEIFITFFSPSGYEQQKNYALAEKVFYFMADNRRNARRFVSLLKPDIVIFVKYELWYFHLQACLKEKIRMFHLSAVFRKDHWMFKFWGQFLQNTLKRFNAIFVQDTESLEVLQSHGFNNVLLTGDTRFDRVLQIAAKAEIKKELALFKNNLPVLVAGSSWPTEEEIIFYGLRNSIKPFKIIIVPHDVSRGHIEEIRKKFDDYPVEIYSEIDSDTNLAETQVLIVDTIGMLSGLYKMADAAFIGGAFGKGLHNMLEACTYGVPICFGPHIGKHWEAEKAVEKGFATIIENDSDFERWIIEVLLNHDTSAEQGAAAVDFVHEYAGATEKVMEKISTKEWFREPQPPS